MLKVVWIIFVVLALAIAGLSYNNVQKRKAVAAKVAQEAAAKVVQPVASAPRVTSRLARDAYLSLKRIEATTEIGVNITEYTKQRAEAWFQVKTYLESPDSKSDPEIAKAFGDAIEAHRKAAAVWRVTIEELNHGHSFTKGEIPRWAQSLRNDVPDLDRFLHEGSSDRYLLKYAIQEYWGDASRSLKTVSARFQ